MPVDENGNPIEEAEATVDAGELEDFLGDAPETPAGEPAETPVEAPPEGQEPTETPEDDPIEETPPADEPSEEPPVETPTDGEPAPSPASEIQMLKEQNAKLLKLIAEGGVPDAEAPPAASAPTATPQPGPAPAEITVAGLDEMLESMDFDDVMDNKDSFRKFVTKLAVSIKTQAIEEGTQRALVSMPQVVSGAVQRQATLRDVANRFYKDNPELMPVKRYVAQVANQISAQNPELTLGDIMKKAAEQAYNTLGIVKAVEDKAKKGATKPKAPALPGGTQAGGKRNVSAPTGLQGEIDDFLND